MNALRYGADDHIWNTLGPRIDAAIDQHLATALWDPSSSISLAVQATLDRHLSEARLLALAEQYLNERLDPVSPVIERTVAFREARSFSQVMDQVTQAHIESILPDLFQSHASAQLQQ